MAASEPGSATPPIAERCLPCSRVVSSSGTVGMVMVIRVRSVGEGYKEKTREGGEWRKEMGGEKPEVSVLRCNRAMGGSNFVRLICMMPIENTAVHNERLISL